MTESGDPPRLLEPGSTASGRLRALLEQSRADVATDGDIQKLEAMLAPVIWPSGAGPAAAASKTAAGKGAAVIGAKVAAGALAIAGGVWFAASRAPAVSHPVPPATTATATAIEASPPPVAPVPLPVLSAAPSGALDEEPAPSNASGAAHRRAKDSLSEADLLGQAQAALSSDPARALSLAERHRHEFARGVLVQEREVIAIEALAHLGRSREAAARGERFLRGYPASAHRSKIESIVGVK